MTYAISDHALVQAGRRLRYPVSRSDMHKALAQGTDIFRSDSGIFRLFHVDKGWGVAVIRNNTVVTVLDLAQAFADCPQAVFAHLVSVGEMRKAFYLRARYHSHKLPQPLDGYVQYSTGFCNSIWAAFQWRDQRKS